MIKILSIFKLNHNDTTPKWGKQNTFVCQVWLPFQTTVYNTNNTTEKANNDGCVDEITWPFPDTAFYVVIGWWGSLELTKEATISCFMMSANIICKHTYSNICRLRKIHASQLRCLQGVQTHPDSWINHQASFVCN